MKGILFSSDFVIDNNGNERLLEINTDTGILNTVLSLIDFTEFFSVLNQNNITKINVVYKNEYHKSFVDYLESKVQTDAVFITTFDKTIISENNIFPTIPTDTEDTFILRLAYDESAIIDSEYAKGTMGLLKLFVDNDDANSVCNFYHSSSLEGLYNTLELDLNNNSVIPDFVVKTTIERKQNSKFYKVGKSELSEPDRVNEFISVVGDSDKMIQQFHFSTGSVNENNKITSLRSFKIVYGSELDLISLVDYKIESILDLPVDLNSEIDNTKIDNKLSDKHYYEFATNFTKAPEKVLGGLLGTHEIMMADDSVKAIQDVVVGDRVKSYFISGSPMRDNVQEVFAWSITGNTFPSGSFLTSSFIESIYTASITNNLISELKIGGDVIYSATSNTFLVYQTDSNSMIYKRSLQIDPSNDLLINNEGNVQTINENNLYVLNEDTHKLVEIDVEEVDTYLIAGTENLLNTTFILTHNWYCFPAGTEITLENGDKKNIEDIEIGDMVLSFNEESGEYDVQKVLSKKQPIHNDLVKYTLSNKQSLISTYDHPIYVNGLNLASYNPNLTNERYEIGKEVVQIKVGDVVKLSNNIEVSIESIEVLPEIDTQTYIISVENNHNFFANNILVHNK